MAVERDWLRLDQGGVERDWLRLEPLPCSRCLELEAEVERSELRSSRPNGSAGCCSLRSSG